MAKIIPKLNLNRTPQAIDNYSLVAAKNIKLNKDNSFSRDIGIANISISPGLVGCISHNTKLYLFHSITENGVQTDSIIEYDEIAKTSTPINSAWHYSGGIIDGKVVVNLRGETLLIINEYFDKDNPEIKVPIKTINLNKCSADDDESIYTQTPKLQLFDLILTGEYLEPIQAGVYTFFARYEIKDGFYTNWFPVSRPFYVARRKTVHTIQGTITHIDEDNNSGTSFVFSVSRPTNENLAKDYKYLQIGFILSRDGEEVGRSWKKFPVDVETIYFDNDKHYIEEVNIDEFFNPIYNNYNVKNLTTFKHKTYISNYIETNANPELKFETPLKESISITIQSSERDSTTKYANRIVDLKNNLITYVYAYGNNSEVTDENNNDSINKFAVNAINKSIYGHVDYWFWKYFKNHITFQNSINHIGFFNTHLIDDVKKLNATNIISDSYTPLTNTSISPYAGYVSNLLKNVLKYINTNVNNVLSPSNIDSLNFYIPENIFIKDDSNDFVLYYIDDVSYSTHDTGSSYLLSTYINSYLPDNYEDTKNDAQGIEEWNDTIATFNIAASNNGGVDTASSVMFTKDINYTISEIIKNAILGFTYDGTISANAEKLIKIDGVSIKYVEIKGKIVNKLTDNDTKGTLEYHISDLTYHSSVLNVKANPYLFENNSRLEKINTTTFIPEQKYSFYIHFVKNTGEITNGYHIKDEVLDWWDNAGNIKNHNIFYPNIVNNLTEIDKLKLKELGYDYYFISCYKTNTTIECTGNQCLEFDLLLNRTDDVKISYLDRGGIYQTNGNYIDDNVAGDDLTYFGSGGYLNYKINLENSNFNGLNTFIINHYENYNKELSLTKLTPYTALTSNIEHKYNAFNCLGYIVEYTKPNYSDTERYISSGEAYTKNIKNDTRDNKYIGLNPIEGPLAVQVTTPRYIYSNYNLNFIKLNISIQEGIKIYEVPDINDSDKKISHKQFISYINSISLKDLYIFPTHYKDFTTYNYYNYNPENNRSIFDNTIRSSRLSGDEANTFIIAFNALDYYNVPTNKGIVIKLAGIGDTMLVHTQDSIFEFSGKPSIASDSAAQIVETDIFDSGITEVIPSEYGMAGLQHKDHAIVTPFGYVFWDAQINTVYYYAGKGQLAPISDPIRKLLDSINPTTARFSYDYVNDRFFINFINAIGHQQVTLSYNVKAKAFVSFHDFNYNYSVNTKNKTYYIKSIAKDKVLGVLSATAKSYASFYNPSNYIIHTNDEKDRIYSYVDVIVNDNYEKIKTLDSVSWICGSVKELSSTINETVNVAEDVSTQPYPGNKMVIYSDTCSSGVIPIHNENLKTIQDYTKGNYKTPVYNLGKFNLNYFRNVNLGTNIEQTLIYGKYFCIRLFFDVNANTEEFDDFKLENIELLYTLENYGKI